VKLVHVVGFITKKFVTTQHGNTNVKLLHTSYILQYVDILIAARNGLGNVQQLSLWSLMIVTWAETCWVAAKEMELGALFFLFFFFLMCALTALPPWTSGTKISKEQIT
jgi:hypothetical protein